MSFVVSVHYLHQNPLPQAMGCSNLKSVTTIDEVWKNIDRAAVTVAQKLGEVAPHHRI
ncbi:hypothetical protein [Bacillus wiedmannii]|uniref:hypothetical protein n=1 Tax=Bacillus wiedmannii TaxID=1890302 RepID=UPI001592D497